MRYMNHSTNSLGGNKPFCGGSLISSLYVLTAAHCTIDTTPSSIRVIVGDHSFSVTGDGEQFFNVQSILVHPQYNSTDDSYDYSILRLVSPVTVPSPTTGVICLPPDTEQTFVGAALTVSGWGRTRGGMLAGLGSNSQALKATVLTGISNENCQSDWSSIGPWNICAIGNTTSSSACKGDSGGEVNSFTFNQSIFWQKFVITLEIVVLKRIMLNR